MAIVSSVDILKGTIGKKLYDSVENKTFYTPKCEKIDKSSQKWSLEPSIDCGLSFDEKTGQISGIPNQKINSTFKIKVTGEYNGI